jgi:hypothetical protein
MFGTKVPALRRELPLPASLILSTKLEGTTLQKTQYSYNDKHSNKGTNISTF